MAKSDSFFIRAQVTPAQNTYEQTTIDLGAYVDALGKSVLRIHNVAAQVFEGVVPGVDPNVAIQTTANITWQLTTQSQSALVQAIDKSVVASGRLDISNTTGAVDGYVFLSHDTDVMPQMWTNGYLIATENIFLGGFCDQQLSAGATINLVLECTVETMSQNAAMALALSQQ